MYSCATVPFLNSRLRAIHFAKHGGTFNARDEFEYERLADHFMSIPLDVDIFECVSASGNRNRLQSATRWFGVAYNGLTIRTLHIRSVENIAARGGPLGFVNHKCSEV